MVFRKMIIDNVVFYGAIIIVVTTVIYLTNS